MTDRLLTKHEVTAIKRDADALWQEIHRQLESGVGVPKVEMNRLHWRAALQELEILRDELAELRRPKGPISSNQCAFCHLPLEHGAASTDTVHGLPRCAELQRAEIERLRGEAEVADEQLAQLRGFAEEHRNCAGSVPETRAPHAETEWKALHKAVAAWSAQWCSQNWPNFTQLNNALADHNPFAQETEPPHLIDWNVRATAGEAADELDQRTVEKAQANWICEYTGPGGRCGRENDFRRDTCWYCHHLRPHHE